MGIVAPGCHSLMIIVIRSGDRRGSGASGNCVRRAEGRGHRCGRGGCSGVDRYRRNDGGGRLTPRR